MEREAASLPAAVPETEGLTALIQKADEWKAKAAALAAQKAPLKKMREVLHMGLRMPVEVPQVEALRAEIRRREWEDTARKVSSNLGRSRPCAKASLCVLETACPKAVQMALHVLLSFSQLAIVTSGLKGNQHLLLTLSLWAMHADLPQQSCCRSISPILCPLLMQLLLELHLLQWNTVAMAQIFLSKFPACHCKFYSLHSNFLTFGYRL